MNKYLKNSVIKVILKELPFDSPYHDMSNDNIQSKWFVTKRHENGLELTQEGNTAFIEADIEYHDRPLPWPEIPAPLLKFDARISQLKLELLRKITCPYYIYEDRRMVEVNGKSLEQCCHMIRLYDEGLTVWIDLRGGIEDYLKSVD